ncbi:ATP-dependent DNA helicase srs2 [Microbotryomycetes sp. JL201]|nr:ATP-dependent DNA helicase srs2 [Microbotryomycetes sp. JL201]
MSNGVAVAGSSVSGPAALKQTALGFDQVQPAAYIATLNDAQRKAVTAPRDGCFQILAGPGSGKTKVLTSRVAYLLQHYQVDPADMIVVTFTNKAANEMRLRLTHLVGAKLVDKLMMGTFHSVCVRYLRKYGKLMGLSNNFVIADREDCLNMIKRAVTATDMTPELKAKLKPNKLSDIISQCKSKQVSPEMYRAQAAIMDTRESAESMEAIHRVYVEYQQELERNNALDFDDLLLQGLELFERFPKIVSKIRCVLIDEFQDTNSTQYTLVKLMARANKALTIVGDPDQSIYGWRNADIENLVKMSQDFKPVQQIYLEQNYRSTAAILGAALAVVRQDAKRVNKGLKATHTSGSSVVVHHAPSAFDEAQFIAAQIKQITAHAGGLIDFGDIAVLLRYGALSRNIEVAFQKESIPHRVVGGHKFFDRVEVKDMISYLQLADNPTYSAAFHRVVNSPKRGFGEKTVKDIEQAARTRKLSLLDICVKLAAGQSFIPLTSLQRNNLKQFVQVVLDVQKLAEDGTNVPELISKVVELTLYEAYLERTYGPDAKERMLNIEELKSFAEIVGEERAEGLADDAELEAMMEPVDVAAVDSANRSLRPVVYGTRVVTAGADQDNELPDLFPASQSTENPLRTFLAMSMLATDTTSDSANVNDAAKSKVTITTVHAAKGLEWPVVFVPACESGVFPFYRAEKSDQVDEESATRMAGAKTSSREVSPFIKPVAEKYPTLFVKRLQKIGPKQRKEFARVLDRPAPDEQVAARMIADYESSLPENPPTYEYDPKAGTQSPTHTYDSSGGFQQNRYGRPSAGPRAIPQGAKGFSSALSRFREAGSGGNSFGSATAFRPVASKAFASSPSFSNAGFGSKQLSGPSPPHAGHFSGSSIPLAPSHSAHSQGAIDDLPAPPPRQPFPPMRANARNQNRAFRPPRMGGTATTRPSAPLGTPIELDSTTQVDDEEESDAQQTAVDMTARITAGQTILQPPTVTRQQSQSPQRHQPKSPTVSLPKLDPQGLPNVPETRSSRIADAVLVNPRGDFEGVPSDLLERWTKGEKKRFLDAFQGVSGISSKTDDNQAQEEEMPSSDSVIVVEQVPSLRHKRGKLG